MSIIARYGLFRAGAKFFSALVLLLAGQLNAGRAAAAPIRLLVFGDSLAAGYGLAHQDGFESRLAAALRAQGKIVEILDGGVSGDTTAGGRARIDWALAGHPDAAIVELGGNDGLRGTDPHEMEANLTAILDALDRAHVPTLLTGMEAPPNLGSDYGAQFRAVFERLSHRPGLLFDRFFLEGVAGDPGLNQPDGIHPNPEGVRRIAARIARSVVGLLAHSGR